MPIQGSPAAYVAMRQQNPPDESFLFFSDQARRQSSRIDSGVYIWSPLLRASSSRKVLNEDMLGNNHEQVLRGAPTRGGHAPATNCIRNTRSVCFVWIFTDQQNLLIGMARSVLLGSYVWTWNAGLEGYPVHR